MWIFQRRKRILSDTLLSYDMLQSIANNPEINLTEEELGVLLRSLVMYSDMNYNHFLTNEAYEAAQSVIGKIEEAI